MFLSRVLIVFLVFIGLPVYAMTIKAPDIVENGAVVPVEIRLDRPMTAGQILELLVNGEPAAQVRVMEGKLSLFSARVRGSQSNTSIVARVIANGRELDSASRNVEVRIIAPVGGTPTSVENTKVRAQSGDLKMLMNSANGFAGTLVVQDAGFRVEISGSAVISRNPFVGLKGEFSDRVSASINASNSWQTQQSGYAKAEPSLGAGDDPEVVGGSYRP